MEKLLITGLMVAMTYVSSQAQEIDSMRTGTQRDSGNRRSRGTMQSPPANQRPTRQVDSLRRDSTGNQNTNRLNQTMPRRRTTPPISVTQPF